MRSRIVGMIKESIMVKEALLQSDTILAAIEKAAVHIDELYRNGKKLLVCGNGGSAADAQHLAGEMVCKFKIERRSLPAIALTTDSSILTAVGNDFDFSQVFQRQVAALGESGDILLGISTSGNSQNIVKAFAKAREMGLLTIGLLGKDGGTLKTLADLPIVIPAEDTPRIQESHILIVHIICEIVEREIFG
jgi:D-sedoheptulose 7-phosphate isomerase